MRSIITERSLIIRIGWLLLIILIVIGSRDLFIRGSGTGKGEFLGTFSYEWGIGLIGYGLIALGAASSCIYGLFKPIKMMERIKVFEERVHRKKYLSWMIAIGFVLFPLLFLLGPWGWRFDLPNFQIMLLVCFSILGGISLPIKGVPWFERSTLMIFLSASLWLISERFLLVTDYPFATSWSEGNRLWDYSLYFGRDRYTFSEDFFYPTYLTPGRHGLWGLPFLFLSNPSIVLMRIWDVILWTFPYLFLGLAVFSSRHSSLTISWRWIMAFWTFLFLYQGPIYAPIIISGMLLAVGYHRQRFWQSLIITALACFYAGISRWTWMVAPAAWAVLWALVEEDLGQSLWKRIQRPLFLGLAGLLGAVLSLIFMDLAFPRPDPVYATSLNQPLLWYRLWSSATNPTGVVNGLIYAVGPLLIWLLIMIVRQRVNWDWLKIVATLGVLIAFLGVGLVASVKIGGGSNIHNLDMFLVSLVFLLGLVTSKKGVFTEYPWYAWVLFAIVLFLPIWNLARVDLELEVPENSTPQKIIAEIQIAIEEAAEEGEILFIDQRQLLTFGQISNVPLVMDYELKDMMNQAMGHNEAYFKDFREDLELQRFRLIVSDPLYTGFQGRRVAFGEENDAWVEEVTIPILEHYESVMRFNEHNIWLLAPKEKQGTE